MPFKAIVFITGCNNHTYGKGSNDKISTLMKWETIPAHIIDG